MSRIEDEDSSVDTQIEMGRDEDVQTFEIDEGRGLIDKIPKKVNKKWSSMLGKACVLSIAGILFILMMVELWSDYGTAISTQTLFPPKIHNVLETCPVVGEEKQLTKSYNALECAWERNTTVTSLTCEGNLPTHPLVEQLGASQHYSLDLDDKHLCLTWQSEITECVRLLIWSI